MNGLFIANPRYMSPPPSPPRLYTILYIYIQIVGHRRKTNRVTFKFEMEEKKFYFQYLKKIIFFPLQMQIISENKLLLLLLLLLR